MNRSRLPDYYFNERQSGMIGLRYRAPYLYLTNGHAGTLKGAKVRSMTCAVLGHCSNPLFSSAVRPLLSRTGMMILSSRTPRPALYYGSSQRRETCPLFLFNTIAEPVAAALAPCAGQFIAAQGSYTAGSSIWAVTVPDGLTH
ncbi:hypothetical protein BJX65DRAFT_90671 [Aspergillus insuetus]